MWPIGTWEHKVSENNVFIITVKYNVFIIIVKYNVFIIIVKHNVFIIIKQILLRSLDIPQMVEALQAKHIRDITCGSNQSAAITSNGELYTWGSGEDGCLGHGDRANQLRPKQVGTL